MKAKQARSQVALAYIRRAEYILKQEYLNISNRAQNIQQSVYYMNMTGEDKVVRNLVMDQLKEDGYTTEITPTNQGYIKVTW